MRADKKIKRGGMSRRRKGVGVCDIAGESFS